ncbi:hypothetical protein D3C86_1178300 [compost metagenome]
MLERWPAKQPDLRYIGRAQPGHATLALDRFDHGRLFTADIRAGTPAQMDLGQAGHRRRGAQLRQRLGQHGAAARVLIAQVDIDGGHAGHARSHQHALQEAMRIALQVDAVLERARLAFVDIDGHQAWRRLGPDDAPFAASGKARPAEPAQAGVLHHGDQRVRVGLALLQRLQQAIAALGAIVVIAEIGLGVMPDGAGLHAGLHGGGGGGVHRMLAHQHGRRPLATADAGCGEHADIGAKQRR